MILSTSRPVPLAVKYFFDLLDDQAAKHGITDPETIHIWKTNRYSMDTQGREAEGCVQGFKEILDLLLMKAQLFFMFEILNVGGESTGWLLHQD